jgi:hypothetical protein
MTFESQCTACRVLPAPPGPTRVITWWWWPTNAESSASSRARRTNDDTGAGGSARRTRRVSCAAPRSGDERGDQPCRVSLTAPGTPPSRPTAKLISRNAVISQQQSDAASRTDAHEVQTGRFPCRAFSRRFRRSRGGPHRTLTEHVFTTNPPAELCARAGSTRLNDGGPRLLLDLRCALRSTQEYSGPIDQEPP